MTKYLIIGLLALASPVIAGDYEGYDNNGNHWNTHIDDNGRIEGHDNNGHHWSTDPTNPKNERTASPEAASTINETTEGTDLHALLGAP